MIHICNNVTCSCGTKYCSNCCNGCPGCGKGKAIISVASTTNAEPTIIYMDKPNYEHLSHTHCFQNENNPCGLNGRHCCLCDIFSHSIEPVEPKEDTEWQARQQAREKPFEQKEDWALEFDKRFIGWKLHHKDVPCIKDEFVINEIKDFIKSVEKEAFKEGYDAAKDDYHIID